MTLASLMDAATWDLFWWSIIPSSQTALHLRVSMDPLVFSRSSRALLALVRSSARSVKGLTLLLLEMAAIGEMLVGMSSREASASSTLTWDEVLTAWSGPSGFLDGVMRPTAVVDLLGDEHLDSQLDGSSTAWDRRLLTSSHTAFSFWGRFMRTGDQDGRDLTKRQYLLVWFLHGEWRDVNL